MASITITIEGLGALNLSSREDYQDFLKSEGIKCVMLHGVRQSYGSLVDGGTYKLGPPIQQQQQRDGKFALDLVCVFIVDIFKSSLADN